MRLKDILLALSVVVAWGINFVVIKVGLHGMPPFLLAGLRFALVAFPAVCFIKPPAIALKWLVAYGMTISFGQFAFLFLAIKLGMPAGIASLVLQAQAFFTMMFAGVFLAEKLKWHHLAGMLIACFGMLLLARAASPAQGGNALPLVPLLLTLGAALSWGLGNITNKVIAQKHSAPMLSLVVWSALIPVGPFFFCAWLIDGPTVIQQSLANISTQTVLSLIYLSFLASLFGYAIWGNLLKRYETWRIAPLSLLVPVVGLISANLLLGETLSGAQVASAMVIIAGLLVNMFGGFIPRLFAARA
ncbi:DME family transporter ydeD [Pseudomonas sp. M47T1]|uniref:O-acetylserine/cysteine exporter n=1 Tax=Pseudomonas sp. M47T1 TaxID=1179778 RepID=UPI0002607FD4|nr:O-acetylserine/cysteine exporter [Pseudomonas sp. M47T1]EIK97224.1 DME family transporter ydeD [Pseudomonas sp. M47T1]